MSIRASSIGTEQPADEVFVHVAVTASGGTHWLAAVTDAHYLRAQAAFS